MTEHTKIKNENNEILKAGCLVVNDHREVLLVTDKERKIWTFPKGHAEHGETLEQAALREVEEETGYSVKIIKRLSDLTYAHGETGELIRVAMFMARPAGISKNAEEETEPEWFTIEKARKILYHDYRNLAPLLDEIKN